MDGLCRYDGKFSFAVINTNFVQSVFGFEYSSGILGKQNKKSLGLVHVSE